MNDMWSRGARTRRWLLVLEVLGALALTALSLAATAGGYHSGWGVAATVCVFAAFLVRRHSMPWTFALAATGGALQLVDPHGFILFANALYAPVCATFGMHRDARVRRVGLVGAIAAAVLPAIFTMPRVILDPPTSASPHWTAVVGLSAMFSGAAAIVSVGGWTWGYLRLQQRRQVESALATQLSEAERLRLEEISAQSAFREQIAAEMHDVVGHSWAVVAAQADGARYAMRTSPDTAEKALETIADLARTSITELREILRQLRYSEGVEGQVGAEQQLAMIARMRDAGMTLDFTESGHPPASQAIRLAAHRVLTETLTNALKHGDLRQPVRVTLTWHGGFTLDATNRIGQRPLANTGRGDGLGIAGMRDRARSLGGDMSVTSDGHTWIVHAEVPGDQVLDEDLPTQIRPGSNPPHRRTGAAAPVEAHQPVPVNGQRLAIPPEELS